MSRGHAGLDVARVRVQPIEVQHFDGSVPGANEPGLFEIVQRTVGVLSRQSGHTPISSWEIGSRASVVQMRRGGSSPTTWD